MNMELLTKKLFEQWMETILEGLNVRTRCCLP